MTLYATRLDRLDLADQDLLEPDWAEVWDAAEIMELIDPANATGGAFTNYFGKTVLRVEGDITSAGPMVKWTRVEDGNHADVDMLALVRYNAMHGEPVGLNARCSGDGGTSAGYSMRINSTGRMEIAKIATGVPVTLVADATLTFAIDTWYWYQFRLSGTTLQARGWEYGAVPTGWLLETTDSTYTAAGFVGINCEGNSGSNTECWVDFLSVGTGGDISPMPQLFTAPTLNQIVLYPSSVRVDASSLAIYYGPANVSVDWSLSAGDGTLTAITDETDAAGISYAKYVPGTAGDKTIQVTHGT